MPELPEEIRKIGFDFDWDIEKVWALDLPVQQAERAFLEWHFDVKFLWGKPEGYYDLTPKQVLDNLDGYPEERDRITAADLSFPIDYMWWKGRPLILDGLHRLMKAHIKKIDPISVREVPAELKNQILKE